MMDDPVEGPASEVGCIRTELSSVMDPAMPFTEHRKLGYIEFVSFCCFTIIAPRRMPVSSPQNRGPWLGKPGL